MAEEETVTQENYIDIHPLKKGRRILVFLADFFIHFILTYLIFNIAAAPIGKAITNYNAKNEEHVLTTLDMYDHYYNSKVLLRDSGFDRTDVTAGVEYTYRCFLSYFVLDTEESIDAKNLLFFKETCIDKCLPKLLIKYHLDCFIINGKYPARVMAHLNSDNNINNFYTHIGGE